MNQGMLENFPEYIDCQLRLAAIAARGGKRDEAMSHLRAILKQKHGNADALAFMGAEILLRFFSSPSPPICRSVGATAFLPRSSLGCLLVCATGCFMMGRTS